MSDKKEKKRKRDSTDKNERPAKKQQNITSPAMKVKFIQNQAGLGPVVGTNFNGSYNIKHVF